MALPPLDPTTTPRLNIVYTGAGLTHKAQVRLALGTTSAAAVAAYNLIAPEMAGAMAVEDAVTGAEYIEQGSNVANPLSVSAFPGLQNFTADPDRQPVFISFTGRGPDGRKTKFSMYSPLTDTTSTGYRQASIPAVLADIRTALISASARTISGSLPVWHSYVNYGQNAYWQGERRKVSS